MKNGIQSSQFDTSVGLFLTLLADLCDCALPLVKEHFNLSQEWLAAQERRDAATIKNRCNFEGIQFLTMCLPNLGKVIDKSLEAGKLCPEIPKGFKPWVSDKYPIFLQAHWRLLESYCQMGPEEFTEQHAKHLRAFRSLLYCAYKAQVPPDPKLVQKALDRFVENDAACGVAWTVLSQYIIEAARPIFAKCIPIATLVGGIPKHGPGAVATGERGPQKWRTKRLYESLHREYPYWEYFYGTRENGRFIGLAANARQFKNLVRNCVPTSKVAVVPKDSRGPRIICAEPLEYMYIQQAIAGRLVKYIESNYPTIGLINFTDQCINRFLALESSKSKQYATIDLKDASDMVSVELVRLLCPDEVWTKLAALRTTHASLPDGRTVELQKFAPMGSAMCFPVESVVFYSICVAALMNQGAPFEWARVRVHVYGDDLIVPTEHVHDCIAALHSVGLVVNKDKCCYRGNFRESCGMDAFNGFCVTPVRVKHFLGQRVSDGTSFAAWCEYSSSFLKASCPKAAKYCHECVERVLGFIPKSERQEAYLCVVDPDNPSTLNEFGRVKWDEGLQSFKGRLWTLATKLEPTALEPWERLLRNLTEPSEDRDPSRDVVARSTKLKKKACIIYAPKSKT